MQLIAVVANALKWAIKTSWRTFFRVVELNWPILTQNWYSFFVFWIPIWAGSSSFLLRNGIQKFYNQNMDPNYIFIHRFVAHNWRHFHIDKNHLWQKLVWNELSLASWRYSFSKEWRRLNRRPSCFWSEFGWKCDSSHFEYQ